MPRLKHWSSAAAIAVMIGGPARAGETIDYTYDALGRLTGVVSSGSINNGQASSISYDPAGNRINYTVTGSGSAAPVLSIGNASATEGQNLVFTVNRTGIAAPALSVNWATVGGTATSGNDFIAGSGTLSFAAGETSKTVTISTVADASPEGAETMMVTLSSPGGGATIGAASGTGTIIDNSPIFAIGGASTTEGGNLVFTVTRSGNLGIAAGVNYATAGGSATSGADFTATSGTLTFAANQTSATIIVATIDDPVPEDAEAMTVTLSSPTSAIIATATGSGSIFDNEPYWSSVLTSGAWTNCNDFGCGSDISGYDASEGGALSSTTFGSYTITRLREDIGLGFTLVMGGGSAPPNSGWTTISVPGEGVLNRASATYSKSGNQSYWNWASAEGTVTSGTVVIR